MKKKQFLTIILILCLLPLLGYAQQPINKKDKKPNQEILSYIKNKIEVRDIKIRNYGTQGLKAIKGEIKNHGNRTLKQVELILYAIDKNEQPIYEYKTKIIDKERDRWIREEYIKERFIGYIEGYIKSNYTRKFELLLDPPLDWGGKVRIKVISIEFQDL